MSEDLFEDSTMTFGEHIEELRAHLWRAIIGIVIAFFITMPVGQYVVKIIVEPVETQLEAWYQTHLKKRTAQMNAREELLPEGERRKVRIEATLTAEQIAMIRGIDPTTEEAKSAKAVPLKLEASLVELVDQMIYPLAEVNQPWRLRTLSATEAFMIYFKSILGAAVVVASPWVFYQVYSFVSVGLYAHERRFVNMTLPFSVVLFLMGVLICYFLMFPLMLQFFLGVNDWMDLQPEFRLNEWVGFAVVITLIFGVTFQLPLFMLLLERVGIISYDQLKGKRRMAIFIIFIFAAVVTPADPLSQSLLAIPMCLLFELGLLLMRYFERSNPFAIPELAE